MALQSEPVAPEPQTAALVPAQFLVQVSLYRRGCFVVQQQQAAANTTLAAVIWLCVMLCRRHGV